MKENVKKWFIKAMEDLKVVEHEMVLLKNEIATSAVCFHCQQFVEKVLKAYLTIKNVDFGKTHNLEFLLELCRKQDRDFEQIDTGNLTFYAVDVRYPDEFYIPSFEEARECYEIAKKVKEFIERKLNIKIEENL
ncbi:DNA-binding protein [Candidatus Desulfofervidus auxilii]|uniref:DNA-binding protein n=1 Tax=Desulfofervidus auxilii TaxID=1621989 RepID=A0A7U4TGQ6_DESA2|nr:HEPN domain-containing protein [Candidatus Desulfofervidus auxilii]AMM40014.1 DNA-binding protein [Candidatus Desulfofervidus auxilii]CAD7769844.1 HEPN domain protein [Candidatus Methanoperedenaceae archaeon GB50]CAD7770863.1 HEPN domain protein [Candidatus Methanoperedenaceae archaeon GB37]CAD7783046.1 MAG: HEPN domain protein [Candidatus Methanoperedenaceae archaeon GB50]